jgi:hypothetical protein
LERLCFSLWYLCYFAVELHYQHRAEADVSHLISDLLGFPVPSQRCILKGSLKLMLVKHFLVLGQSE